MDYPKLRIGKSWFVKMICTRHGKKYYMVVREMTTPTVEKLDEDDSYLLNALQEELARDNNLTGDGD